MSTSASIWPIEFVRGIFGRVALWRRIESLDRMLGRARRIMDSLKAVNAQLLWNNRQFAEEVARLEKENGDMRLMIDTLQDAERKVDPNAKCPSCGHKKGHLSHVVKEGQVRPLNNCEVCGFTFMSSPPIAGEVLAAQLYQSPQTKL